VSHLATDGSPAREKPLCGRYCSCTQSAWKPPRRPFGNTGPMVDKALARHIMGAVIAGKEEEL